MSALNQSLLVTYLPVFGPKGLIGVLHFSASDFDNDTAYRILGTLLAELDEEYCAHA